MTPFLLFAGFCLLAAIWTAVWRWVLLNAGRSAELSRIEIDAAFLRYRLYIASAVVVAIFAASIY
jgi:hypothetical protein